MVISTQLVLAAGAKRVSDAYGGAPGVPDEAKNVPYRQLIITTAGAAATLGSSAALTGGTGFPLAVAGQLVIGPFPTGAVKLSDLYAVGAGATLSILGVPY